MSGTKKSLKKITLGAVLFKNTKGTCLFTFKFFKKFLGRLQIILLKFLKINNGSKQSHFFEQFSKVRTRRF